MSVPPLRIELSDAVPPDTGRRLIADLVALVRPRYPVVVEKQAIPAHPLAVVGPAIVSSSISTAESIAHLSMLEREADPHSLLRDLVDKTITFAWLAADPQPRVDAWERDDAKKRLQVEQHVSRFGTSVLEPAWKAHLDKMSQKQGPGLPGLADRATQADEYWGLRIPHFAKATDGGRMFDLLYAGVFRYTSSFTHSMPMSIYKLVEDTPDKRVVLLEDTQGPQRAVRFAPIAFAVQLYVASESLGWPTTREIDEIFENRRADLRIPSDA